MRIGVVAACPFPSPQGTQVYVRGFAEALRRAGHDVRVLCYHFGVGEYAGPVTLDRIRGLPGYTKVRAGPHPLKPGLDLQLARRVRALSRAGLVDVWSAHNVEGVVATALGRVGTGVPMIAHLHGRMDEELPSYAGHGASGRAAAEFGKVLDGFVPRLGDSVAVLSEAALAWARGREWGAAAHLWPPGIDPEDVPEAWTPRPSPRPPTFAYVGNPDRYQEPGVLGGALARWAASGRPFRLVLAGASSFSGWVDDFVAMGVPQGSIEVREAPDWRSARAFLLDSDAAVVPRGRSGGFPMKLLNVVALGVPCVAARGAATDGLAPWAELADDGDAASFRAAMERIVDGGQRSWARAAAGRRWALEEASWARRIEAPVAEMRRVVSGAGVGVG